MKFSVSFDTIYTFVSSLHFFVLLNIIEKRSILFVTKNHRFHQNTLFALKDDHRKKTTRTTKTFYYSL